MYRSAKLLAERMEWSLAEVMRRALEDFFCRYPANATARGPWKLPAARPLGGDEFFANPDWRYAIHTERLLARETPAPYETPKRKRRR